MTARLRQAHVFQVGDKAQVIDNRDGRVVDTGEVTKVAPMSIVFYSPKVNFAWAYKRKGERWIELAKDHYELQPL